MIKDVLTKKPFARITPTGHIRGKVVYDLNGCRPPKDTMQWQLFSQADFIREFFPWGHKIYSKEYYPDKIKYDEENKRYFEERVFRVASPLQMVITAQILVHLCGNDIRHELLDTQVDKGREELFLMFQRGWFDHKLDIDFYYFAKSVETTADGAIAFYLLNNKVHTKVLSFLDGDTLFPHYDGVTGRLNAFARKYTDYDDGGEQRTVWVEVWDEKRFYRYRQDKQGVKGKLNKVKDYFGLESFTLVDEEIHGFNRVPIVYKRKNGPCWEFSQDNIDKYELAISHLCQNNMAYAFPIMLLKGSDVEIQGDIYGAVKAITMGADDDASFMKRPEDSGSFELQLNTLLKLIFMGSFAVMPPEVKSGDLPGVAIKLIYSPSLEKAMNNCKEYNQAITDMQDLFLFGYGVEQGRLTEFLSLKMMSWAEPYIHQNAAELINNLVQACNSGILSKQSGSELTGYDRNNEWDRIMREHKEEQEADLVFSNTPNEVIEVEKTEVTNSTEEVV